VCSSDLAVIGRNPIAFDGLGGSEYLKVIHNKIAGDAPEIEPEYEKRLHSVLLKMIKSGLIKSAHDISEGGIAVALAECCVMNRKNPIGCEVNLSVNGRNDFELFNESQSRIIISLDKKNKEKCKNFCREDNIDFISLGITGGTTLYIYEMLNTDLEKINNAYFNSIIRIMETG
jgi:phosphoribosylformylglycinamidine synthase